MSRADKIGIDTAVTYAVRRKVVEVAKSNNSKTGNLVKAAIAEFLFKRSVSLDEELRSTFNKYIEDYNHPKKIYK